MKKRLLILFCAFASLLLGESSHAEMTSEEAQRVFDAAVARGDLAVVKFRRFYSDEKSPGRRLEESILVDEISGREAILLLAKHVSIRMPEPVREMIDGEERWVTLYTKIDCDQWFEVFIKKGADTVLQFSVYDDDCIGCNVLLEDSVIAADPTKLAPLLASWRKTIMEKGEPGATDNPGDAQRVREDH